MAIMILSCRVKRRCGESVSAITCTSSLITDKLFLHQFQVWALLFSQAACSEVKSLLHPHLHRPRDGRVDISENWLPLERGIDWLTLILKPLMIRVVVDLSKRSSTVQPPRRRLVRDTDSQGSIVPSVADQQLPTSCGPLWGGVPSQRLDLLSPGGGTSSCMFRSMRTVSHFKNNIQSVFAFLFYISWRGERVLCQRGVSLSVTVRSDRPGTTAATEKCRTA